MTKLSSYQKLPTQGEAREVVEGVKYLEMCKGRKIHGNQTIALDIKASEEIEFIAWGKIKSIANATPY